MNSNAMFPTSRFSEQIKPRISILAPSFGDQNQQSKLQKKEKLFYRNSAHPKIVSSQPNFNSQDLLQSQEIPRIEERPFSSKNTDKNQINIQKKNQKSNQNPPFNYTPLIQSLYFLYYNQDATGLHIMDIQQAKNENQKRAKQYLTEHYGESFYHLMIMSFQYYSDLPEGMSRRSCLAFIKDFCLLNENLDINLAEVFVAKHAKKMVDFISFIDILAMIAKRSQQKGMTHKEGFQRFVETYIFSQIRSTYKQLQVDRGVLQSFFDGHSQIIRGLFKSIQSNDVNCRGLVSLQDFQKMCYNYDVFPIISNWPSAQKIFQFFQQKNNFINYEGFVKTLIFMCLAKDDTKSNFLDHLHKLIFLIEAPKIQHQDQIEKASPFSQI